MESSPEEKELGVLVDEKLNMAWKRVLAARESQPYPGVHQKKHGQQVKGGDAPSLLCSRETPSGALSSALEPPA